MTKKIIMIKSKGLLDLEIISYFSPVSHLKKQLHESIRTEQMHRLQLDLQVA